MSSKCVLLLVFGCIALAAATPLDYGLYLDDAGQTYEAPLLIRQVRSPGGGSLDLSYSSDQSGRSASAQYNQNLYRSNDGRFNVDAYAQATRNIDYNRNDYGGGITGSLSF